MPRGWKEREGYTYHETARISLGEGLPEVKVEVIGNMDHAGVFLDGDESCYLIATGRLEIRATGGDGQRTRSTIFVPLDKFDLPEFLVDVTALKVRKKGFE